MVTGQVLVLRIVPPDKTGGADARAGPGTSPLLEFVVPGELHTNSQ